MYTNSRKHTYDQRYQHIRNARQSFENEPQPASNIWKWIVIRFIIAAILFLTYVLLTQFPDIFPNNIGKEVYEEIKSNDLYTKLQNYVIMLLYEN